MPLLPLRRKFLAAALSLSLATPALASGPAAIVPGEFESLMEGDTEYLDVTVLGQRLGMFPVTVRPDTVTFDHPQAVIDALLGNGARLDDGARDTLATVLSSRLSTHESLACSVAIGACGYVATDAADVILDRQRGSLSLFLRPDWLARKPADARLHLPSGDTERALIHRQSVLYAGGRDFQSLSMTGTGAVGLTDAAFAGFDWRMIHQSSREERRTRWDLRSAYARQDIGRTHYIQAGRMDMRNLASPLGGNFGISMQPFPRMQGVRVGTTQAYVNREVAGRGTPVTVILTQPARVDAYRGEELLGSSYLQAGMQTVDTSSFPVGSYPVTLRVIQNGAEVRSEITPFVREGGSAATITGVEWFAQAGRALYDDDGSLVYERRRMRAAQFGVRVPVARGMAVGNSASFVAGHAYDETRVDAWLPVGRNTLSLSATQLVGSDGTRGQMQQLSFGSRVNWNLYRYHTATTHCEDRGAQQLRGYVCSTSVSATASTSVAGGQATLGYTRAASHARRRSTLVSAADPWLPRRGSIEDTATATRSISASYARVFNVGRQSLASVGLNGYRRSLDTGRHDHGAFLTVTLTRLPTRRPGKPSRVQSLGTQFSTPTAGSSRASLSASETRIWQDHGYKELGMQASGDEGRQFNAAVNGRYDSNAGRFTGLLSGDRTPRGGNVLSASAGYTSAFAVSRSGFYLGADAGGTDPSAGVAVSARGSKEAAGSAVATVSSASVSAMPLRVGQKRLIAVDPFRKTTIETRDARPTATTKKTTHVRLEAGAGPKPWFLTPGRLGRQVVESRVALTYVGRLLFPTSPHHLRPRLLNATSADMDESGAFVAEFDHRPEAFYAWRQGEAFLCRTDRVMTRGAISRVDVRPCEAVAVAALPVEVREKVPTIVAVARTEKVPVRGASL